MKITQLNHVAIGVKDVKVTNKFYEEVLGLKQIPRPNFGFPGTWFRLGVDQELHIIQVAADAPDVHDATRGKHFALMVDDMDATQAHLKSHNISYTGPHHRPDGAFQVFFKDPDGNMIECCTAPKAG